MPTPPILAGAYWLKMIDSTFWKCFDDKWFSHSKQGFLVSLPLTKHWNKCTTFPIYPAMCLLLYVGIHVWKYLVICWSSDFITGIIQLTYTEEHGNFRPHHHTNLLAMSHLMHIHIICGCTYHRQCQCHDCWQGKCYAFLQKEKPCE